MKRRSAGRNLMRVRYGNTWTKLKKAGAYLTIMVLLPYIITVFIHGPGLVSTSNVDQTYIKVKTENGSLEMPIEEYCVGILAKEIPANYEEEEAKAEKEKEAEPLKETTTDLIINDLQEKVKETNQENADQKQEDSVENGQADVQSAQTSQTASGKTKTVSFNSDSKLLWPVNGNILMSYSMDKTVYFSTLDQYKYNPALVIAGAEGDQVISAAPGIVKSIDQSAETGLTVNVDIGNGYELFYGQLKEVPVKVGDQVEAKTIIGYVSAPTKYYSVEGSNVYFEMRKDGQPVNPMEYLVE